jgi:mannose-6-phosphate isomerase-like protein (cupin superfamily)
MSTKTNLRCHTYDFSGKLKKNKNSERKENNSLDTLVLANIVLKPNTKTKKETLTIQEKVLFFMIGSATMFMNDEVFTVQPNDVVLLPKDTIYYIDNYSSTELYYNEISSSNI